jgi:hypothetical protein
VWNQRCDMISSIDILLHLSKCLLANENHCFLTCSIAQKQLLSSQTEEEKEFSSSVWVLSRKKNWNILFLVKEKSVLTKSNKGTETICTDDQKECRFLYYHLAMSFCAGQIWEWIFCIDSANIQRDYFYKNVVKKI